MRPVSAFFLFLFSICSQAYAHEFSLKTGKSLFGILLDENEIEFEIRTEGGILYLPKHLVVKVDATRHTKFEKIYSKYSEIIDEDGNAGELVGLLEEIREEGYITFNQEVSSKVLEKDPENEYARRAFVSRKFARSAPVKSDTGDNKDNSTVEDDNGTNGSYISRLVDSIKFLNEEIKKRRTGIIKIQYDDNKPREQAHDFGLHRDDKVAGLGFHDARNADNSYSNRGFYMGRADTTIAIENFRLRPVDSRYIRKDSLRVVPRSIRPDSLIRKLPCRNAGHAGLKEHCIR